jgi:3-hydroxy-3-methylglutaryl CoA synthase/uncharacterized OB-fold protein
MAGITAYGAYVPRARLQRGAIRATLGAGGGKGTRAVASYDEDTTSMAVEAGRIALRGRDADVAAVDQLYFATAAPAYLDKTNATAVHAGLALGEQVLAADFGGAVRSGVAALLAASQSTASTLVALSDTRTGRPGGVDEAAGGDAAAVFVLGEGTASAPVLAEVVTHASATGEFLDRWRLPGDATSKAWEERFGETEYVPLADAAFAAALKQADLTPEAVDHFIVVGVHPRAAKAFAARTGVRTEAFADDHTSTVGNTGTAAVGLVLADVLDRAGANETIVAVVLADGATAVVLRTTDALPGHRAAESVAAQVAAGDDSLSYATFLSWKGFLDREPPRRPDPVPPYAPPAARAGAWKYGFVATRCTECGTRWLPPARVCEHCKAVDKMAPEPMADVTARIRTFSVDNLAFTPSPPLIGVVLDFDGGGRFSCELTDADAARVAVGDEVEMTFRRTITAAGIHNYFWKARPVRTASTGRPAKES